MKKEAKLNRNDKRRLEILKINPVPKDFYSLGGVMHRNFSLRQLKKLEKEGFLDPEMTQNDSPCIGDIMEFMKANPRTVATGYLVSPDRSDYRVSIEGVIIPGPLTMKEVMDFVNMFRYADEFDLDPEGARAWYD